MPETKNRLAEEKSLYLKQHAENPVEWFPWGSEAFDKASREDKPVLVSIGYASCHWCHVMAHESFEDDYIAKLMNTHFVCMKVDREERPDVDRIYMEAVQMLNGHGGWPLNVFCFPDGRPFAGGTYFPPDERRGHNIVPWPQLLLRIADYYTRNRDDLEENAKAIIGNLEAGNLPYKATGEGLSPREYLVATGKLLDNHDAEYGGFGGAPKFPPSMNLDFLLAMRATATVETGSAELAESIDSAVNRTLTAMAHGGLFDQVGGGFSRYSVDAHWLIPHFEKMLYDNALLVDIYSKAFQRYPKPLYRRIVEETIAWLEREMRSPAGPYYAALDADTEGEEGSTYLWTPDEVRAILGPERGDRFCAVYGITDEGNFETTGRSNPALLEGDVAIRDELGADRERLLAARMERPQPGRDDKCLVSWNALMVRGLARAGMAFNRDDWLRRGHEIASWLWEEMRREGDRMYSISYDNVPGGNATVDDIAHTAEAFLAMASVAEFIEPGTAPDWINRASCLVDVIRHHFSDTDAPGYYYTSDDHERLAHRSKEWYDSAIPSGNASVAHVLSVLSATDPEGVHATGLEHLKTAYPGIVQASPSAAAHALSGFVYEAIGVAVIKYRENASLDGLREGLSAKPWRPVYILPDSSGALTADYQLCVRTECLAPVNDAKEVIALL